MKRHIYVILSSLVVLALMSGCGKKTGWEIKGNLTNSDNDTLTIESYIGGRWIAVDTVFTDSKGDFGYQSATASPYPEIYRISLQGQSIYFPVDSAESLVLTADGLNFAGPHSLTGSLQAQEFSDVDSLLNASITANGTLGTLNDSLLKVTLNDMILSAEGLMTPYYTITKTVEGKPLYNPENKQDLRMIGAVANKFNINRPEDTRTAYLTQLYTTHKFSAAPGGEIVATVSGLPEDITRYDLAGNEQTLTKVAKGRPATLLSFTRYDISTSPAYNVELNNAWEKYHGSGLQIYQIVFDDNEATWRTVGAKIPWISVWNGLTDSLNPLNSYQVETMPTTFVINSDGEVVERITDPSKITSSLAKYF